MNAADNTAGSPPATGRAPAGPGPAGNGQADEPSSHAEGGIVVEGVMAEDGGLVDGPVPGEATGPGADAGPPAGSGEAGGAASAVPGAGGQDAGAEPEGSWLHGEELRSLRRYWREIQVSFVDDPPKAVTNANTMVADLMRRLAQALFDERAALETRCLGRDDVSTEDLRQGLRRYRAIVDRLLTSTW